MSHDPVPAFRAEQSPGAERRDTLWVTAAAFALYCLLLREPLHPPDAHIYIQQVLGGEANAVHFLYSRSTTIFARWVMPLGLSAFEALRLFSALGGALAVALGHRALLALGLSRGTAVLAAGLLATCPSAVYYATTVEVHAGFLALANAALWSAAALPRHPGRCQPWGALRTGVATTLATGFHATGHLLLSPIAVLLWLGGRRWRAIFVVMATHALGSWLLGATLDVGRSPVATSITFLCLGLVSGSPLENAIAIMWTEWFRAFLPISVCGLATLFAHQWRRESLAWHVALLPYLLAAALLLHDTVEFGAYVMPMAVPFAWITARALPARWLALLLAASLGTAVCLAAPFRCNPRDTAFASDAAAYDKARRIHVYSCNWAELDALARETPAIPSNHLAVLGPCRTMSDDMFRAVCHTWQMMLGRDAAAGREPVFTASALEFLRAEPGGQLARLMREYVDLHYCWQRVALGSFEAYAPRPR